MDLRRTLLQAELTRIEREGEAKSYAIMGRAADLELAHNLCVLLNTGVEQDAALRPCVVYEGDAQACRVKVFAADAGADVLRTIDRAGIGWSSERGSDGLLDVRVDGFDAVEVVVDYAQFALYLERIEAAA